MPGDRKIVSMKPIRASVCGAKCGLAAILGSSLLTISVSAAPALKAFPTAEGFGANAVGCVNGAHDIVLRHLRVRIGGNMKLDAGNNLLFYGTAEPGVHDVIADHCSVSWGSDTQLDRVLKEAGFEGVEPMGGMNREEVLAALKETGLQAASVC